MPVFRGKGGDCGAKLPVFRPKSDIGFFAPYLEFIEPTLVSFQNAVKSSAVIVGLPVSTATCTLAVLPVPSAS